VGERCRAAVSSPTPINASTQVAKISQIKKISPIKKSAEKAALLVSSHGEKGGALLSQAQEFIQVLHQLFMQME